MYDADLQRKLELLEKEIASLTEEVLSLRREQRAEIDGLRLDLAAVKMYLEDHHPDYPERFLLAEEKARTEVSPE